MPIYAFENKKPRIDDSAFIHPQAVIIGDVTIGPRCFIGPGAVLRGDFGAIEVGANTSIQDNAVVHVNENTLAKIGQGCIIAHSAILHHPSIGAGVMVGMNSVILHASEIGDECMVASLSLLREGSVFPPRKLIAGNPARAVKDLGPGMIDRVKRGAHLYAQLSERYQKGLVLLDTP